MARKCRNKHMLRGQRLGLLTWVHSTVIARPDRAVVIGGHGVCTLHTNTKQVEEHPPAEFTVFVGIVCRP